MNAYLATLDPGYPIKTLSDVIQFNIANPSAIPYRQRWLLDGEAINLEGQKAAYETAIERDRLYSRDNGIDYVLKQNNLDAIIHTGSHDRAARAGYPVVSIPLHYTGGTGASTNIIFIGTAFTEALLLEFAYIVEQAANTHKRVAPGMADLSSLQTAIGTAQRLPASDRLLIQATYNSSLSAYTNSFLRQIEIDKANNALRTALLSFWPADKTSLNELVEIGQKIDIGFLSPATSGKFQKLFDEAAFINSDELSLTEEIDATYKALYDFLMLEELMPITLLRIDGLAITTVTRGETHSFSLILNEGANKNSVVWTIADTSFGSVDNAGNVIIFDRTGNVRLTAADPISGISHNVMLRIAS